MAEPQDWNVALPTLGLLGLLAVWLYRAIQNIYFHPLSRFPGPKAAAATTYWKAYIECILEKSFCTELGELHAQYGPVVRVGPNELHFSNPQAYHDIYNNRNRWNKEWYLYHSFGEDRSSFGFITYKEAKERKDVLNKSFSPEAIRQVEPLIVDKVNALCAAIARHSAASKPVDIFYAFRCMTMDVITYLSFGKSVDAINEPDFKAPIIEAMNASLPVFVRFKHADWYKNMIINCPPNLSKILSPATGGLVDLQQLLRRQIKELVEDPDKLKDLPHGNTIYARLMDKEAYRTGTVPSAQSLYEESQALMFGGGDTVGNTLLVGTFHLLKRPETYGQLKKELLAVWPSLEEKAPTVRELEDLPYLNAVIKESLRLSSGVISGLLRVVPADGANIDGVAVPGGTIVSIGSTFVHYNKDIFPAPQEFRPERWLDNPDLDNWLVTFSRGPRMCLGINLAWAELRLLFAYAFRKFDMVLTDKSPESLPWRETFLPVFTGEHVKVDMTPVAA